MRNFLFFSVIVLTLSLALYSQPATDKATVRIVLKDRVDSVLNDIVIELKNLDGTVILKGKTNQAGLFKDLLPKGKKYKLYFHVSGKESVYDVDIPNEPGERSYRFVFKLPILKRTQELAGSSEEETGTVQSESEATIIIQNFDKERLANHHLSIINPDGSVKIDAKTDSDGVYKCMLLKGKSFKLHTYEQGQEFTSTVKVPSEIDYFIYRFNIGMYTVSKTDSTTEEKKTYPPGAPIVRVIIRVVDKYKIPEQDAQVTILKDGKQVFAANTNIDGECDTILNREDIYRVVVEKFAHTFPFTMEIPKDFSQNVFLFEVEIQVIKAYSKTIDLDIQFETGKYIIKGNSFDKLDKFGKYMKDNPALLIEVAGHTDSQGDFQKNMVLSQNRSNVVRQYLITNWKVEPYRMVSKGYGPTQPVATNKTPEGRQKNRRTEARIIEE